MNRRNFLSKLGIGAAACVVAPVIVNGKEDDIDNLGFNRDKLESGIKEVRGYHVTHSDSYSPKEIVRHWRETGIIMYGK